MFKCVCTCHRRNPKCPKFDHLLSHIRFWSRSWWKVSIIIKSISVLLLYGKNPSTIQTYWENQAYSNSATRKIYRPFCRRTGSFSDFRPSTFWGPKFFGLPAHVVGAAGRKATVNASCAHRPTAFCLSSIINYTIHGPSHAGLRVAALGKNDVSTPRRCHTSPVKIQISQKLVDFFR